MGSPGYGNHHGPCPVIVAQHLRTRPAHRSQLRATTILGMALVGKKVFSSSPPRHVCGGQHRRRSLGCPNHRRGRLHRPNPVPLAGSILLIVPLTGTGGANSWTAVQLFDQQKQIWPETFLELPHGNPLHGIFERVLAQQAFSWVEACIAR